MATVTKTLPKPKEKKSLKKADNDPVREFQLSTEMTDPSNNLQDYSILLFGEKKIGKTKLASLFPDSYFIRTEEGTKGVRHRGDTCANWKMFRKMLRLLRKDKSRTVIVDTVDLLFKQCNDHQCFKLGIDHPSEEDWGKGWAAVRDEFTEAMQELMGLGKGVILISHATEREVKRRNGQKYDRLQPTMPTQARDICEAIVDIWAYFTYEDDARVLIIQGDDHVSAGHRLDERFRWKGRSVRQILMTDDPTQGYKNFVDCFHNRYEPPPDALEPEETDDEPKPVKKIKKLKVRKA